MFTAHAAVLLQRWHANSKFGCYDSTATDHPLLDDLNYKDSKQLKRLVHDTFPNVSTTPTTDDHFHDVDLISMFQNVAPLWQYHDHPGRIEVPGLWVKFFKI